METEKRTIQRASYQYKSDSSVNLSLYYYNYEQFETVIITHCNAQPLQSEITASSLTSIHYVITFNNIWTRIW